MAFLCSAFTGFFLPWLPDVLATSRHCSNAEGRITAARVGLSAQCCFHLWLKLQFPYLPDMSRESIQF